MVQVGATSLKALTRLHPSPTYWLPVSLPQTQDNIVVNVSQAVGLNLILKPGGLSEAVR
jgi:hypothetical protein